MHNPPTATVLYCCLSVAELFQRFSVPILPMRDRTRRISVLEAVAGNVRQMHRVAGLLQALGQRQDFGRAALQAVYQQHGVFTASQRNGIHLYSIENRKKGGILANPAPSVSGKCAVARTSSA